MVYPSFYKAVLRSAAISMMILAPVVLVPVAQAQAAGPISRPLTLTYTGTVQSSIGNTVNVRQPDGTIAPWTGSLPAYPYKVGDPVTISFTATVPTKAYYDTLQTGTKPADGIYKISVISPYYSGGAAPGGIGNSTAALVSGSIAPVDNMGQPTNTRMTIYYNYNTDTYSIGSDFASGSYGGNGVGLIYDAATGQLTTCDTATTCRNSGSDPVIFTLKQQADGTITTGDIQVASTSLTSDTGTGFFSLIFNGIWNLPTYGGGSGATQVPEPGMIALFGVGALVPVWRRRRAIKSRHQRAA